MNESLDVETEGNQILKMAKKPVSDVSKAKIGS